MGRRQTAILGSRRNRIVWMPAGRYGQLPTPCRRHRPWAPRQREYPAGTMSASPPIIGPYIRFGLPTSNDAAMLILSEHLKTVRRASSISVGLCICLLDSMPGVGFRVPAERTSAIPRPVSPDPNLRG